MLLKRSRNSEPPTAWTKPRKTPEKKKDTNDQSAAVKTQILFGSVLKYPIVLVTSCYWNFCVLTSPSYYESEIDKVLCVSTANSICSCECLLSCKKWESTVGLHSQSKCRRNVFGGLLMSRNEWPAHHHVCCVVCCVCMCMCMCVFVSNPFSFQIWSMSIVECAFCERRRFCFDPV